MNFDIYSRRSCKIMKINKDLKDKIVLYFELGLPVSDVSVLTGLSISEIHELSTNNKDIKKAQSAGAKTSNIKVIEALLKSAIGYDVTESDVTEMKGRNDTLISKTTTSKTKHVQPNVNAIKYWLDNRASSEWKESIQDTEKKMNIKISVDGKNIMIDNED